MPTTTDRQDGSAQRASANTIRKHWPVTLGLVLALVVAVVAAGWVTSTTGGSHRRRVHQPTSVRAARSATTGPTGTTTLTPGPSFLEPGHVTLPTTIGQLTINPGMTRRNAGPQLRASFAKSFSERERTAVAAIYTRDPKRMGFSKTDPLLLVMAVYLFGTGVPDNAMKAFLDDPHLSDAHQVAAGPMGGSAGCATLSDGHGHTVAQCAWADVNTYASFEAWYIPTKTVQQLMLAARPQIEVSTHQ